MTIVVKRKEIEKKFPQLAFSDKKSTPFNIEVDKRWISGDVLPICISLLGYSPSSFYWFKTAYELDPPNFNTPDPKDGELLWKTFLFQNEEKIKEAKENYCLIISYDAELIAKKLDYKIFI